MCRMNDFHDRLTKLVGHQCQAIEMKGGELVLHVALADLVSVLKAVRDDTELAVTQLSDLTAVDFPERPERFDVVYQMLSVNNNMRLRIITRADEGDVVPSVIGLFRSADWAEREVWDMFGIYFSGHPDMRRLLTDYGFEGHPLRKDFPLTGYVEVRYSDTERRVVYEPVHLNQEYRDFDFLSPWEGMQLPQVGDDSDTDEEQAGA
ncbi:MAG: NADH-quinone oxidoreductase subunit C [Alphaproteobacteria bacterium]|nr:NADH-quinone oxidoreductase subunit C [Alphaproteobacteria bacterium]MBT7220398.1 NADH-quinone oxidoreductase subunit C [Alphaproteobacteria bacterium]